MTIIMKCGDFPSTRFALQVRHIANGQEQPNASSIESSKSSDAKLANIKQHLPESALTA
jgi:hypothetical protein